MLVVRICARQVHRGQQGPLLSRHIAVVPKGHVGAVNDVKLILMCELLQKVADGSTTLRSER